MTWIEKKENWFADRIGERPKPARLERSYSVSDAARIMGVSRGTIFKWLSIDEPENAVIPPSAWWRRDNGYIMIKESILLKLQADH